MEIRFLSCEDSALEISNIYEKSWKYAYKDIISQDFLDSIPAGRWANSINAEGRRNLVVTENGRLIGTLCLCRSRWEKYSGYGEIVSIYFLPEYMGKGYGTQLLGRGVEELKGMGYENILLWVLEDNLRARRFYERNGFKAADEYLDDNIGGKSLREMMYIYSAD